MVPDGRSLSLAITHIEDARYRLGTAFESVE